MGLFNWCVSNRPVSGGTRCGFTDQMFRCTFNEVLGLDIERLIIMRTKARHYTYLLFHFVVD
jgi:hypothetical protein